MDLWYPRATRVVIGGQAGGTPLAGEPKVVLHTTEGSSIAGAEGAYRASGGSAPHFTISPGAIHQHIPLNRSAYSLQHPGGTPETNRAGLVTQIEEVGWAGIPPSDVENPPAWAKHGSAGWPDSYYDRIADLVQWIHEQTGVPLKQVSNGIHADYSNPVRIPAGEFAAWSGVCGHVHVPSNVHTDPGRGYHIGKVI